MKSSEAGEQNNPALKSCGGHTPKTKRKHIAQLLQFVTWSEIKTRQQQRKMTENICKNTCLLISVINSTSHMQEKTSPIHEWSRQIHGSESSTPQIICWHTATILDKYRDHTLPETEGSEWKTMQNRFIQCKKQNKTLTRIIKTSTKKQRHNRHTNPGKKTHRTHKKGNNLTAHYFYR